MYPWNSVPRIRNCTVTLNSSLHPYCRTIRLKLEIWRTSIETAPASSKSFERKCLLLWHSIRRNVFMYVSLFTKAIHTYKYLFYLTIIIVNEIRWSLHKSRLYVCEWYWIYMTGLVEFQPSKTCLSLFKSETRAEYHTHMYGTPYF